MKTLNLELLVEMRSETHEPVGFFANLRLIDKLKTKQKKKLHSILIQASEYFASIDVSSTEYIMVMRYKEILGIVRFITTAELAEDATAVWNVAA